MFDKTIVQLFKETYLRKPTAEDLEGISALHQSVHGFPGMLGSLDCMHTYWKNCPKGWQGSYKGKEYIASIVLETIADYNLWIWHAAYGYAGTLNDRTIFAMSPWLESLIDGSFDDLEKDSGCCPYMIGPHEFDHMYVLVAGIYLPYSRFVQAYGVPIGDAQVAFTTWQESVRKDIERTFGVLQAKWQCLARPSHTISLEQIGMRMASCIILHNMCVADRINEEAGKQYFPALRVETETVNAVANPEDLLHQQGHTDAQHQSVAGVAQMDQLVHEEFTRRDRWIQMADSEEMERLREAMTYVIHARHQAAERMRRRRFEL